LLIIKLSIVKEPPLPPPLPTPPIIAAAGIELSGINNRPFKLKSPAIKVFAFKETSYKAPLPPTDKFWSKITNSPCALNVL